MNSIRGSDIARLVLGMKVIFYKSFQKNNLAGEKIKKQRLQYSTILTLSFHVKTNKIRFILGYLQSEQLDQIAFDFCKSSPYLREEYKHLKRGLKIIDWNNKRSLIDIIRQFIEIEGIGEYFMGKWGQKKLV